MTERFSTQTDDPVERGWAALPPSYRIPAQAPSLAEAKVFCDRLARSHYENFHVATWLLPKPLRPHFSSIYAYCRISDDLGDEVKDSQAALALLDVWENELNACYAGRAKHPVFVALAESIHACQIPKEPFADLLTAFRRDQTVHRYETVEDVLGYCRYSANPVGRLVLYACGLATEERFRWSDATCSALQLANFWQDVGRDYDLGRIYLPLEDMRRQGVEERAIAERRATPEFRALLRQQVGFTRAMFKVGRQLIPTVPFSLAVDLELFSRGGEAVLQAIEKQDYDVLARRPVITKSRKAMLLLETLGARILGRK
ncbi:MAG TPA: squalene synthase HpnC [Opitutaceae bacterium]|jgi:squalene synthase HpnC